MLPSEYSRHPPIHEFRYDGAGDQIDDDCAKHAPQLIHHRAAISAESNPS